jgi:hypothetical protein
LGQGGVSKVYRVESEGDSRVLKVFDTSITDAKDVAEDATALRVLAKATEKTANGLHVVKVRKELLNQCTLELDYVQGFELGKLADLLAEKDPKQLDFLVSLFNQRMASLVDELRNQHGIKIEKRAPYKHGFAQYRFLLPGTFGEAEIPPFNVILNLKTLEMTIIDGL